MRIFVTLLTWGILVILLSGCFEMVEDIWINPDSSGRLKLDIAVSEKAIALGKLEG